MSLIHNFPPIDHTRLRWDTSSKLGEGAYGIVYRGLFDANPVAVKVIKHPSSSIVSAAGDCPQQPAELKQQRREIDRYHVLRNQFIVQHLGSFRGDDARDLHIVTEYLEGGSLHDSLARMREHHAVWHELSFLTIASHIARALLHMHNQKLTHGDIKPQNVLLTALIQFEQHHNGSCTACLPPHAKAKLCDFGLSKRLEGADSPHLFGTTAGTTDFGPGAVGTYIYMSPESYKGVASLSDDAAKASDIYAYGMVLFELLSGLQSWRLEDVRNVFHLMILVREGNRPSWGPRKDHFDPRYIQFVEKCWRHEPTERPTIGDVVDEIDVLLERYKQRLSVPATNAMPNVAGQHDTTTSSAHLFPHNSAGRRQAHVPGYPSDHSLASDQRLPNPPYNPVSVKKTLNGLGDTSDSKGSDGCQSNRLQGSSDRVSHARKNSGTHSTNSVEKETNSSSYDEQLNRNCVSANSYPDEFLDAPTLVHVESKALAAPEVRDGLHDSSGLTHYSPKSSDEDSDGSDGSIAADIGTLHLEKDEGDNDNDDQRDEIDDNVVEIVERKHVKSAHIPRPQVDGLVEIQGLVEGRKPVMGLVSVAAPYGQSVVAGTQPQPHAHLSPQFTTQRHVRHFACWNPISSHPMWSRALSPPPPTRPFASRWSRNTKTGWGSKASPGP